MTERSPAIQLPSWIDESIAEALGSADVGGIVPREALPILEAGARRLFREFIDKLASETKIAPEAVGATVQVRIAPESEGYLRVRALIWPPGHLEAIWAEWHGFTSGASEAIAY